MDARVSEHGREIGRRGATGRELGEIGGAGGIEIARVEERGAGHLGEGEGAFAADEPAADDGEIGLLGAGVVHSVT